MINELKLNLMCINLTTTYKDVLKYNKIVERNQKYF